MRRRARFPLQGCWCTGLVAAMASPWRRFYPYGWRWGRRCSDENGYGKEVVPLGWLGAGSIR